MKLEEKIGFSCERVFKVGPKDLARAVGSGDLDVLGTPVLLAWMEELCWTSISPFLEEGTSSVGTKANLSHLKASPLGASILVQTKLIEVDRRRLVFCVKAFEQEANVETCIAEACLERFVVDIERFLNRTK